MVLPFNPDELTNPVREVKKRGTFITVVDRGLKDASIQDIYVAGNNPEFGRVAGKYFVDNLKQGNVVVFRGIPTVIDEERVTNFEKALEGSGVKVIDKQYANWNRDDAFKVMQDFLSKHPKIDAVWASDDDMALGVMEAIRQAKREDIKFVLGGAGMKDMVKRVMDGDKMIPADVSYPPAMIATAMNVTAAQFFTNAPMRGTYVLNAQLITKDNAEELLLPRTRPSEPLDSRLPPRCGEGVPREEISPMKTMKGPGLFLAQFAGDAEPFNSLDAICRWAASLGYKGVQIPDLGRARCST